MTTLISAFISGAIFAVGLTLSGMTRPDRIIGFLDITGTWDPTLALVMVGAVLTYGVLFRVITRACKAPVFSVAFLIPTRRDLTPRLVIGSALFGAGWGLAGWCPGPALTSAATFDANVWLFTLAMIGGMVAHRTVFEGRSSRSTPGAAADM